MVEGGVTKADTTEFSECWKIVWTTPYIMKLAFSAGIGGLLFGYDTGVISGALLYIKEDFQDVEKKTWLQEMIVSMAVAGAIFGAAIGGWFSDRFGRKLSILVADGLFFLGALVMAVAPGPWMIIPGRVFVGLGVGMASMTAPLYISEASPAKIRGAIVSTNGFLITGGQFLSYLINMAFTQAPGTWRWMLGVAGAPALLQFFLMLMLPESPRWLYRQNKVDEARAILEKIYPSNEVEEEVNLLRQSIENEKAEEGMIGTDMISRVKGALGNQIVRRGLYAGVAVLVAQQFVGINSVMYYSPTIIQFAGFASKSTALALSLVTSGLNAIGSIVSMAFVDKYGRRKLMIMSMFGLISCLVALAIVFFQAALHAPSVSPIESAHFGGNNTCPGFISAGSSTTWNCMDCLKQKCGFCSNGESEYLRGACVVDEKSTDKLCGEQHRTYFKSGCPSKFGWLAVVFLGLYIITYSPGMGTAPWIVNSEIYPLRYRGIGGGIAAVSCWTSNLIISVTFLTLTEHLGSAGTFLLFAGFALLGLIAIYFVVPETKGLAFEEIEKMLDTGFRPGLLKRKSKNTEMNA